MYFQGRRESKNQSINAKIADRENRKDWKKIGKIGNTGS